MTGTLRITFVLHSMGAGGAERFTANLASAWAGAGHRVTVVTFMSEPDSYAMPGVARLELGLAEPSASAVAALRANVARARALRQVVRRLDPDVVIGVMTTSNVLLALASAGGRHHTIGTEHTEPVAFPLGRPWSAARHVAYRLLDVVTAPTATTCRWLAAHTWARRTLVMHNPITLPLPASGPRILPSAVVPAPRAFVLGAGRLVPEKGFDRLITAFAQRASAHPNWDLVILGDGDERPSLEAMVADLRLDGRVHLPGWAGNVGEWFERASFYVMSSRFEGFGNTIVEAMAHRCPVVSFDCESGPAEIITHGRDGILVPDGDVNALAAAMGTMMSSPQLRSSLSEHGLIRAERFSVDRISGEWFELFTDLGVTGR